MEHSGSFPAHRLPVCLSQASPLVSRTTEELARRSSWAWLLPRCSEYGSE